MGDSILELDRVSKVLRGERILKSVSLKVKKGEFLSIVGASGSGKSTLLYIMGLLDEPTEGRVFFEGREINFSRRELLSYLRNRKIGFVFQFHYLLPEFTALENLVIPMLKRGLSRKEAEKKAREILRDLGLEGLGNRKPYQLSGGQQQRVAIARALANEPLLLLADEPTGNLDSENTRRVMEIFRKINEKGTTIVMVTHERELAEETDRTLELRDGKVVGEVVRRAL